MAPRRHSPRISNGGRNTKTNRKDSSDSDENDGKMETAGKKVRLKIERQLCQVYGKTMSRAVVFKWCQEFRNGRDTLEDQKRSGRPKSLRAKQRLDDIQSYIKTNRHAKLRELGFQMRLPSSTLFNYIKHTLEYKLFVSCWVPIQLSEENKDERVKFSAANLSQCNNEGPMNFTNRIVVVDQTRINFHTTPLNKRRPYVKDQEGKIVKRKKKCRQVWNLETGPSPAINMVMTVFWDCSGVIAIVFKDQDSIGDSETNHSYSDRDTLGMLYDQVCTKRPGLMLSGLVLHMNEDLGEGEDAKEAIRSNLGLFGWQGLFNPANSPDLSPSDYYLFQPLKKHVSGKRFADSDAGKRCVLEWLWAQDPEFYSVGVHDLAARWEKCVKIKGDYLYADK